MKAIRGATTVETDSAAEIKESVKELLTEIKEENGLSEEGIICIMFSNTSDLKSYYPAKAAREAGFFNCALYSSLEPEINGALSKCIRVMVLADLNDPPRHVYLRGAAELRKDLTHKMNIAIDGPAGSGKSTVAKILAEKFKILYLDTGAMYRACALACLNNSVDCSDEAAVEEALKKVTVSVKYRNGEQQTFVNGRNVSGEIRTPRISMLASAISAYGFVRNKMVEAQRKIASENSCVLDGRDIGTNVLPSAEFKFYLTASPEVRAQRRQKENALKSINQSYSDVLKDIILRDRQDETRAIAPLSKADDAVCVNTDNMNIEEVVGFISSKIQGEI